MQSFNELGRGDRLDAVLKHVSRMTSLRSLDLNRNHMGSAEQADLLVDSLTRLTSLQTLNLTTNRFDFEACKRLMPLVEKLPNLDLQLVGCLGAVDMTRAECR